LETLHCPGEDAPSKINGVSCGENFGKLGHSEKLFTMKDDRKSLF
jgi:hypothetical protein